jgi:hypothetical protein
MWLVIGGTMFRGNFFVMKESMGSKDVLVGQPWLAYHATVIKYIPDEGMIIKIWENLGEWSEGWCKCQDDDPY